MKPVKGCITCANGDLDLREQGPRGVCTQCFVKSSKRTLANYKTAGTKVLKSRGIEQTASGFKFLEEEKKPEEVESVEVIAECKKCKEFVIFQGQSTDKKLTCPECGHKQIVKGE